MSDTPPYLQPYKNAVNEYGGSFDATLWQSKEGQIARFEVFLKFVDFKNCTVLDIGCGIGDFAQFLIDRKIHFDHFH